MNTPWPWLTLALLGAYHGLNPAMGWLFAVALGLQERKRAAVLRAFAPIALGHAVSIGVVVALVLAAQSLIAPETLRIVGGIALVAFGLYKLLAPLSHPRWVGMRVGFRDLTVWSFLMATAHGAGLMLVPVVMHLPGSATSVYAAGHDHAIMTPQAYYFCGINVASAPALDLSAVALHTGSMWLVMAVIALVVYEYIGLAVLRRAWFNLDRIWAGALVAAGAITVLMV